MNIINIFISFILAVLIFTLRTYFMYYIMEMNKDSLIRISDSLSEKINVYVSDQVFCQLTNDSRGFLVLKKDDSPNRNKLCNLLIYNYLDQYISQINKCAEDTYSLLEKTSMQSEWSSIKTLSRQIAYQNLVTVTSDQGRVNKTLSLKIDNSKKTKILEALSNNLEDVDLSVFFRGLFQSYLRLPVYQREQVIFADRMAILNKAIKEEVSVSYKNASTHKQNSFFPKLIQHSQHEYFNYAIGQFDNAHHGIGAIRIANMNELYVSQKPAVFSDNFTEIIKKMQRNGVQFSYRNNEKSNYIVTLTKDGFDNYKRRYLERPEPISSPVANADGSVTLKFDCSEFQLKAYFMPFGDNILELR